MSQQQPKQQHAFIYRGRVRSGCLTCRSRKVKCDEKRPICANCARLERSCVYKPRKDQINHANSSASLQKHTRDESVTMSAAGRSLEIRASESSSSSSGSEPMSQNQPQLQNLQQDWFLTGTCRLLERWNDTLDPLLYSNISGPDITARSENYIQRHNEQIGITAGDETVLENASHATLISRDIELTTTMDILATREVPPEPSFVFFLDEVDCPWVTPYDATNWQRMKSIIVEIGKSNAIVTSAIMAVSILYKAQLYGLPLSKAISLYDSAKHAYKQALSDNT